MLHRNKLHQSTEAIFHSALKSDQFGSLTTPIYLTTAYDSHGVRFEDQEYQYSRTSNPTRAQFESCLAVLEGGIGGIAYASGISSIVAVLDILKADAHLLVGNDLYGGTYRLFTEIAQHRSDVSVSFVDVNDLDAVKEAVRPNTRMLFLETPSNPMLRVGDLPSLANIARDYDLLSVCDNSAATPVIQQPLHYGFDIVVHSVTKFIGGHSDITSGSLVVRDDKKLLDRLRYLQNATGSVQSPLDAFLALRSLQTLDVRMQRHCQNAEAIAQALEGHEKLSRVVYPGLRSHPDHVVAQRQMKAFGGIVTLEFRHEEDAQQFLKSLRLIATACCFGGVQTLATHPLTMTHSTISPEIRKANGISSTVIRLSIGLEDPTDLISDIEMALQQ